MGKEATVAIFAYNRSAHLERLLKSLERAEGAQETEVWIFCDGASRKGDEQAVAEVGRVARGEWKFRGTRVVSRERNIGLARNIIRGVSEVLEGEERVIVLEDDLVVGEGFLRYMNAALDKYEGEAVQSIAGYMPRIEIGHTYPYSTVALPRNCSWGWATWRDRWTGVDWEVGDFDEFARDVERRREFDRGGSDLSAMLLRWVTGEINSWSIRFCYDGFRRGMVTIYPTESLVSNGGADGSGTNVGRTSRYETAMAEGIDIGKMTGDVRVDEGVLKEFRRAYGCSVVRRFINRIKYLAYRIGVKKRKEREKDN